MRRACIFLLSFVFIAAAQTSRTVQATGSATLSVKPDQATLDVGVTTNASTAQDSVQQNATTSTAVQNAVIALAGKDATQTVYYSVSPRYTNNGTTIIGYSTNNTIRVTINDLSIIGRLIDAANGAGANTIGSISFGLHDSDPTVQQALAAATKEAMAHAGAIASGLGGKLGVIVSAQEGSSYSPIVAGGMAGAVGSTTTPVQTGTVNVSATVTIIVQLQ